MEERTILAGEVHGHDCRFCLADDSCHVFLPGVIDDAAVFLRPGGGRAAGEDDEAVAVVEPFEDFAHAAHVGSPCIFSAVHIHGNLVGAHASHAVQEFIDHDADIASNLHGNIANHDSIRHAVRVITHNDTGTFCRNVFKPFQFIMERKMLAGKFEKIIRAAGFHIIFHFGMGHVENVESEQPFSQVQ